MQKETILLVEDNKLQRSVIAYLLIENKYKVLQANNGIEALKLLESERVDLVISDVEMEEMGGLQLCQKLKADAQHKLIPFILLTGHERLEEKLEGLDIGANDYIPKSFDKIELLARVKVQLRNKRLQQDISQQNDQTATNKEQEEIQQEVKLFRTRLLPAVPTVAGYDVSICGIRMIHGNDCCDIVTSQKSFFLLGHVEGKSFINNFIALLVKGAIYGILNSNPNIDLTGLHVLIDSIFHQNIRLQLGYREYMTLALFTINDDSVGYIQSYEHLLWYSHESKKFELLPVNTRWIGLSQGNPDKPEIKSISMSPNDILVSFTQGLKESKWGIDGLKQMVMENAQQPAQKITQAIENHIKTLSFNEDITVIVVKKK